MTINHTHRNRDAGDRTAGVRRRDGVSDLFAAALDGDRDAERVLHLWGGFDETAQRASWALLTAGHESDEPIPAHVLAGIDRTLAALRGQASRDCCATFVVSMTATFAVFTVRHE